MIILTNFLYIDPGTGSMLFSILIGAAATLFFLVKALWLKIKVFFSGKKSGVEMDASYKPYVIYNEGKQYLNLFSPIVEEFERRKVNLSYLTSIKDDPIFEEKFEYVKSEYIGEGNAAYAKLNMLSAGIVLMTTPGLNVYQLKRSRRVKYYANIIHGASDPTMMRLFALDFFDAVLLTGEYQIKDIRYLEEQRGINKKELIVVGCPYLDALKEKIDSIPSENDHKFTVLVSPSWGPSALLSKYGEKLLDPLVDSGFNIIIRPHPQSRKTENQVLERITEKYRTCENIEWDYASDNIYSMKKSDIMISDFSGIIYDYTFLCDKPVIYVNAELNLKPYDAYDLPNNGKTIWQFEVLKKIGIELKEENFLNIKEIIQNASDSDELAKARNSAKNEAWMHMGESAKLTVDYMLGKIANNSKEKEETND
ncbi:MAG: CDP-glycerol glycerophosphotransferase family protein [Treponema sp.]|nr:CDP-glycerol glycerophosphotransferase family protein [Treponema sp.]